MSREPSENDLRIAEQVLALYESGEGLPFERMVRKHPMWYRIIEWMLESGQLVASPKRYIFTRNQLEMYRASLGMNAIDAAVPGVGDIKRILGLDRTPAEQLRAVLLALRESSGYAYGDD